LFISTWQEESVMNWKLMITGSLRMMSRFRMRTLFMSIGVALGVAVLIAGRSLGAGSEQQLNERIDLLFGPGTILLVGNLDFEDKEAIESQVPGVVAFDPRLMLGEIEVSSAGVSRRAAVMGGSEIGEYAWNRGVIEGRYLNSEDVSSTARVALIGTNLAATLFGEASPLGEEILVGKVPLRVIGVLEPVGMDPHGEDRDEDVVVPVTTAMRRLQNLDYFNVSKLVVGNHDLVDEDADQIAGILRERHRIAEGEPDDFNIYTSQFAARRIEAASQSINRYLIAAAIAVLLVSAVVIASIMLVVVRERVAEVGLRKALGATEQQIRLQFLAETAGVSLASGILGVMLGVGAAYIIGSQMDIPVVFSQSSLGIALLAAVVVGIAAGVIPAMRAARLDPIEALQ
jgi:putative ABC transport system permease protein